MEKVTDNPWYVLRTHFRERPIRDALQSKGINCFVPMQYRTNIGEIEDSAEMKDNELRIIVHGYVFVEKSKEESQMREILSQLSEPFQPIRNEKGGLYEVPAAEMRDFRMLSDPHYTQCIYLKAQQADNLIGKNVEIIRGKFRGIQGKLTKIKGKYFFIKHVAGLGVMIHISRWYCRVLES